MRLLLLLSTLLAAAPHALVADGHAHPTAASGASAAQAPLAAEAANVPGEEAGSQKLIRDFNFMHRHGHARGEHWLGPMAFFKDTLLEHEAEPEFVAAPQPLMPSQAHECAHGDVASRVTVRTVPQPGARRRAAGERAEPTTYVDETGRERRRTLNNPQHLRYTVRYIDPVDDIDFVCTQVGQVVSIGDTRGMSQTAANLCSDRVLGNCFLECTADHLMTSAKQTYLEKTVDDAMTFLSSALRVEPLGLPLVVGDYSCPASYEEFSYPRADVTDGVPNTDFVLYVTSRPTLGSLLAFASTCQVADDSGRGRPIVGWANFGPNQLVVGDPGAELVAIHEITHALGFSYTNGFLRFRDENNQVYAEEDLFSTERLLWEGALNTVTVLKTPNVQAEVRRHFGCNSLVGAELEDDGGAGTELSHWEKRIFGPEFMTGSKGVTAVFSALTFAALEDSSWYEVDYSVLADENPYGNGAGCGFATGYCQGPSWQSLGLPYSCTEGETACTSDALGKGYCDASQTLNDQCPTFESYFDCRDVEEGSAGSEGFLAYRGEEFSATARCFTSTAGKKSGQQYTPPNTMACYEHACAGPTQLKVRLGEHWYDCPSEGTVGDLHGYAGEISCPSSAILCSGAPVDSTWPVIDQVTPTSGSSEGGTLLTVLGADLLDVTAVFASGVPCTDLEGGYGSGYESALRCLTGSGNGDGTNAVRLVNRKGYSTTSAPGTFILAGTGDGDGEGEGAGTGFLELECSFAKCYILIIVGALAFCLICMCCACRSKPAKRRYAARTNEFSGAEKVVGLMPTFPQAMYANPTAQRPPRAKVSRERKAEMAKRASRVSDVSSREQLVRAFKKADVDGDGTLSKGEIRAFLRSLNYKFDERQLDVLFKSVDADHSGKIDYREFAKMIAATSLGRAIHDPSDGNQLRDAFDELDRDGSGKLSAAELAVFAQSLMGNYFDAADVNEMLREADTDGDGEIDFQEFSRMVQAAGAGKSIDGFSIRAIKKKFRRLDTDGSGYLSPGELRVFLKSLNPNPRAPPPDNATVDHLIQMADADGDGQISCEEFVSLLQSMAVAREIEEFDEELLAQRFHRLDRDGSGALSKNELRVFIASLSPNVRASARISDDMVDDMLNKMDLDGDGEISIDEFMTAMRAMYQAKKNRKKVPRAQPSPRGGGRGGVAAGRGTPYGRGGGRGAGRGAGRGGASPGIQQLQQAHPSGGRGRGGPQRGRGGPARGRGRGAPRI